MDNTELSTDQNGHRPKWAQTKMGTDQNGHRPK